MTTGGDDARMSLGDHLEELRRRLLWPLLVVAGLFIAGLCGYRQLMELISLPLHWGLARCRPADLAALGLPTDPAQVRLTMFAFEEGAMGVLKISFFAAVAAGFPVLLHQLWRFAAPGLLANERKLVFLMLPAAALFFYGGLVFGFFVGLPWFFTWMIGFNASLGMALDLRQSHYLSLFFTLVLAFGAVMDIPWLVLVLVRSRLLTVAQIAKRRRLIAFANLIIASLITPPDPFSQLLVFAMMTALFELGLLAARWWGTPPPGAAPAAGGSDG